MPTGTATFGALISNMLTGSKTVSVTASLGAAVDAITSVNSDNNSLLQAGDNTINVPAGATFAVISFPVTANTIIWKGDPADVGTQMVSNPTEALFAAMLVSGLSSFILNADALTPFVEINFV